MSLRPRYSLLTLLLLTAAIAVGVKLWRGPHRVAFPDPAESRLIMPDREVEIDLWQQRGHFVMTNSPTQRELLEDTDAVIECEYVRQWSDNKVTTACATWKKPRHLLRVKQQDSKIRSSILLENAAGELPAWPFFVKSGEELVSCEQLSCLVVGNLNGNTIEYKPRVVPLIGPVIYFGIQLSDTGSQPVYYLTTNKKIYQLVRAPSEGSLSAPEYDVIPLETAVIADPQVQARLVEQLAKLHD